MRRVRLLLAACLPLTGGCASLIAQSGKDLTTIQTQEGFHAQLGSPALSGAVGNQTFEEYHTRRKIAERWTPRLGEGYAMILVMTCGAADLVCVPRELYLMTRRAILGQKVLVKYATDGTVADVLLDGESLDPFGHPRPRPSSAVASAEPSGAEPKR